MPGVPAAARSRGPPVPGGAGGVSSPFAMRFLPFALSTLLAPLAAWAGAPPLTDAALLACIKGNDCPMDTRGIAEELLKHPKLDPMALATGSEPGRSVGFLALYLRNADGDAAFFRREAESPKRSDEERYEAWNFLARRCDRNALAALSRTPYQPWSACGERAETLRLFGKCGWRGAAPLLIEALHDACFNAVGAALGSLRVFFPDAPKEFADPDAMQTYFQQAATSSTWDPRYPEPPPSGSLITLELGRQTVVYLKGIARVALEPKDIVDARPLAATLLEPRKLGTAKMTIWKGNGAKLEYTLVVWK